MSFNHIQRGLKMKKKAFTLIELLVVISIIALLMSILVPALSKVKRMAKITVCKTRLKNSFIATIAYSSTNREQLPISFWQSDGDLVRDNAWRSYVMKEESFFSNRDNLTDYGTEIFGLGALWDGEYLDDPEIFVCTSTPVDKKELRIKSYLEFDDYKRVDAEYSYMPLKRFPVRKNGRIDYWPHATKAEQLSADSACIMDKIRSWDNFAHFSGSKTSGHPRVNVCFGDGHVVVTDNREFYTKEMVEKLQQDNGGYTILREDLFEFLDTVDP